MYHIDVHAGFVHGNSVSAAEGILGSSPFPPVLPLARFRRRSQGLPEGSKPKTHRVRAPRETSDPEHADVEGDRSSEKEFDQDWFEGGFDPFTTWLEAEESSPEAGMHIDSGLRL